jgi:restriction system protein
MSDFSLSQYLPWLLPGAIVLLLVVWLLYRRHKSGDRLKRVLAEIGYDRIDGLVIPNADDGEIQIDHLLLTSKGLLIVDIKEVAGTVFGSDKMQEWTVISDERRYTFPNPQGALYDRVAAVGHIVRQVPVAGRILFLDGAQFSKGTPDYVSDLDTLLAEFGEPDKAAAKFKIEAFKPHWELLQKAALSP